jgi:class 3 adenylate cyclase
MVETSHQLPRAVQARLVRQLRMARVVAFDFMFTDSLGNLKPEEKAIPEYSRALKENARDNEELARAIKEANNVVIGMWPEQEDTARNLDELPSNFKGATGRRELSRLFVPSQLSHRNLRHWGQPAPQLWDAARWHSHVRADADEDGIVRSVEPFAHSEHGERVPCFGLAIAGAARGLTRAQIAALPQDGNSFLFDGKRIALQSDGHVKIDFIGDRNAFESDENRIVYTRVLDLYFPEDFKDKIVIVGENSVQSKEIILTPFGLMPGMQIQANVVATLLGKSGPPVPLPIIFILALCIACALLLVVPLLRFPLWSSFLLAALQIAAIVLLGQWLFATTHRILAPAPPFLTIFLTLNALALYEYRRTRQTLGRFIGRDMLPRAMQLFSPLHLGGQVEKATAMFCDLRGYSGFSERLAPDQVTAYINQYTSEMVEVVHLFAGRPIDYLGDGIFFLFEQKAKSEDHALRAVRAALEMQRRFALLATHWSEEKELAELPEMGIGIATGEMMIGAVGAEDHIKLSAVGDAVNVASRVQGLTTTCGYNILLTPPTHDAVRQHFAARSCGLHLLRGRREEIEVFGISSPS